MKDDPQASVNEGMHPEVDIQATHKVLSLSCVTVIVKQLTFKQGNNIDMIESNVNFGG